MKRATWGQFESEIAMGDGEKEEMGGGEGHKKTLWIMVRKRKEEQEQDDITHSEMAVMTEPKERQNPASVSVWYC